MSIHFFDEVIFMPYSERAGTAACKLEDKISTEEIEYRKSIILKQAKERSLAAKIHKDGFSVSLKKVTDFK